MQTTPTYDEVFDAQQHSRLILDSMSRPGKINVFEPMELPYPSGLNPASTLIAMALLNTDVTFCTLDGLEGDVANYIALHTSAPIAQAEQADFIFVPGTTDAVFVGTLKTGTLPYPEEGATIVADVQTISTHPFEDALKLTLQGPGVNGSAMVYLSGLNPQILEELKEQNLEFPLGIDLILTDTNNRIICLPRSLSVVIGQ